MTALLTGRTVLVLGASGGVGEGVTHALLDHGATVVAAARDRGRLDELAARSPGSSAARLLLHPMNILDPDTSATTRAITDRYGSLDGVVIAIGDWGTAGHKAIMETSNETWDSMVAANQTSQFRAFKALIPALRNAGALVNLSGLSAELAYPGSALVAATNAANKSLALTLAAEIGAAGPRVYELILGVIRTRPRRLQGIDRDDWYRAEEVGEHAALLIAGTTPLARTPLQYLISPAAGVRTDALVGQP